MRRNIWMRAGLAAVMLALPVTVDAGPMQDFEKQLNSAYAHYRAALLQTNMKNKEATEAAIAAFEKGWSEIAARKASPPPQYADDAKWGETLEQVAKVLAVAKAEAASGDLTKSHNTLEAIRELIGDLRLRNGIMSFSDRINAYHEHMEHVVQGSYGSDAEGLARLREDVAVLSALAKDVEKFKPPALAGDDGFKQALAGMMSSVTSLQSAARAGQVDKIPELRKALKPAYSKLFAKYG